ncbi:hypothetical protein DFH09DRAFT_1073394 [Mycena vulgaris]|nr:hypothetical protein DFH09DRAFT_1073394 [Mycena vulgaris]
MSNYPEGYVDDALSAPCSLHDHPGGVYFLVVKHTDGSIVVKIGRSDEPPRREREWQRQCHLDEIELVWAVNTEHATKLERLVHRRFKVMNAWIGPTLCDSCGHRHLEKFDLDRIGGMEVAKREVLALLKQMVERGE